MEPTNDTSPNNSNKQSKIILSITLIIAVLLVGAIVAAFMMTSDTSDPSTTQQETTSDTATDNNTNVGTSTSEDLVATITFTDNGFSPSSLTVKKGTKVMIVNKSNDNIQFSSDDHPTHTHSPEMNTSEIGPGENTSFTATVVGTHGYHDHIDDGKTGTLIITD